MNENNLRKFIRKTLNEAFDSSNLMQEKLDEMEEASSFETRHSKDRQGPTDSATWYDAGEVQTGEDGKKWITKTASNGVNRWVRLEEDLNEEDLDETMMTSMADDKNMTAPDGREVYGEELDEITGVSQTARNRAENRREEKLDK